jgi:uncharacterized protein (DUF488 family)
MIYTIGYGGRKLEAFIEALKENDIDVVVDVRAFPTSKDEAFKKENLEASLKDRSIGYLHLRELGGFRRPSYQEYMKTEEFKSGVEKLLEEAEGKNIALMCVERSHKGCHRRFISRYLEEEGVKVAHI